MCRCRALDNVPLPPAHGRWPAQDSGIRGQVIYRQVAWQERDGLTIDIFTYALRLRRNSLG